MTRKAYINRKTKENQHSGAGLHGMSLSATAGFSDTQAKNAGQGVPQVQRFKYAVKE